MKYINPYDIAEFFGGLSLANFKKFKKRVLNELELEDNEIVIHNQKFSKNDVYEVLEEIDKNKDLLKNYFTLYMKKDINLFLYGENQNIETILAKINFLDENLKNFITPFLKDRLKEIYKNAFREKNINLLKITPPISKIYLDEIYEPIYKSLKNIQNELQSKKNQKVTLSEIKSIVGDIYFINQLPDYFDKVRNDIALIIRSLSVDMWNNYEDADLAIEFINLALQFKLNSKNKDMFEDDKKQLEEMKGKKKENDSLKKQREKEDKALDKIEEFLFTSGRFSKKLKNINNLLVKTNFNDNFYIRVFNIVFEYINQKTKEYELAYLFDKNHQGHINNVQHIQEGARELQQFLEILQMKVNDYKFLQVIESNLKDVKKLAFQRSFLCQFLMIFGPFGLIICWVLGLFI